MPYITVEFFEGRTVDEKRDLAAAMTDTVVDVLGVNKEIVRIRFDEMKKTDFSKGGVLISDK